MDQFAAMRRADTLARLGLGTVAPNPIVGAVILDTNGEVISEGFHERAGADHAEIVALKRAGAKARGATLVVTLEPCNHQGKTPPCSEAIIAAGISQVIFAVSDPNQIAAGGGARLRSAGIAVVVGILADEVSFTNRAWLKKVITGAPYITAKVATTLDGRIAARDGSSKWITSESARADVATLRSECDAIITGTGTVLADDPQLTVRAQVRGEFKPTRMILGVREIPSTARINSSEVETVHLKSRQIGDAIELAKTRGWNRLLLEAGPTLTSAFFKANLVDELFIYQAPTLLGAGDTFVTELGITSLTDRIDLKLHSAEAIGTDLKLHLLARSA